MKYVVLNENTLGYTDDRHPGRMGVLAGSVIRGGHDWLNGPVTLGAADKLRPATPEDFDTYRVVVPPDYEREHNA